MKVVQEGKELIIDIKYPNNCEERKAVFGWLNEKYGVLKWSIRKSSSTADGMRFIRVAVDT